MSIRPYIALMKLRVVELLLVTTLPALFLAARGVPPLATSIATLIGGTLAAGAANSYNMVIEADVDRLMKRTSKRPLVTGEITKRAAILFASAMTLVSLGIFSIWTNWLATLLTALAIAFYVFVYTIALKRRTSQNIVWGGIAGCLPVLIGWAAVTSSLSMTSLWLFLVVFFWTPPHFWALAIKYSDDYQAAGIPMLPVVAPQTTVRWQMWLHTTAMVVCSVLVVHSAQLPNWTLLITILIGMSFLFQLTKLRSDDLTSAGSLFQASITYLSIYSLALVLGVLIG